MATLSAVISVLNGEKFLAQCLTSVVNIADEIIVVDHGSTDETVSIAKKFTKKIYQQKNNPEHIDIQKNFGFEKATKDWILSLDADEKVTHELQAEIREILSSASVYAGYWIPRKNIIFGKWIEHTGWYPDYQLRLFLHGKGKYVSQHVHEDLVVDGKTEKLSAPLVHEAYQSVYQFLHRGLTIYAPNEAQSLMKNGYEFSFAGAIRMPFQEFLSRFFARKGYLDGFHGLMLSMLMAFYHFAVFAYVWEHQKFSKHDDVVDLLSHEVKKAQKEFRYWEHTARLESTKNPASKVFLHAKRKLGI